MKHTQELSVYIDNGLPAGDISLHPNDGFDLGLIDPQHRLQIYHGAPTHEGPLANHAGSLHLSNGCRSGTVRLTQKHWEAMGKEKQVTLFIKNGNLFIVGRPAKPPE